MATSDKSHPVTEYTAHEWREAAAELIRLCTPKGTPPATTPSTIVAIAQGIRGANETLRAHVARLETTIAGLRKELSDAETLETGTDPRVLEGILTGGGK